MNNVKHQLLNNTTLPSELINLVLDYLNTNKKWCKKCGVASEKVKRCSNCNFCFCEGMNILRYGNTHFYCVECFEDTDDEAYSSADEHNEVLMSFNS